MTIESYKKAERIFLNIENIEKYRNSLNDLKNPFVQNLPVDNDNFSELLNNARTIWEDSRAKMLLKLQTEIISLNQELDKI